MQEPESEAAEGSAIRGRVLDVSKAEGILDLSLRPELIPAPPAKGKKKAAAPSLPQVRPRLNLTPLQPPTALPSLNGQFTHCVETWTLFRRLKPGGKVLGRSSIRMAHSEYGVLGCGCRWGRRWRGSSNW